ncbi:helix-turn-helix domain-containing protein [Micromonospora sp. NPDC018662]|uniref:helix-turn-helix domain-containing protein n=1 Tax=Micromonospora sp. NPDC018662 TaxID=3364238 RepID=UPI00379450BE
MSSTAAIPPTANQASCSHGTSGVGRPASAGPVCRGDDDERCGRLDELLTAWAPVPVPAAAEATALVEEIRTDRGVLRVADFARRHAVSTRRLQRLFLDHVGVGPKWVIRRYRLQEAIEQATTGPLDWSRVAAELGYADQAHLVREFTAVAGVSPAAYARSLADARWLIRRRGRAWRARRGVPAEDVALGDCDWHHRGHLGPPLLCSH